MIEQSIILLQIIFIDIILAADNAIIIGLIAANFVPKHRKQIILWGVAGALVFKVIFAVFATYLFKFYFIKILGGLLLIWIVNDLRKDLVEIKKEKNWSFEYLQNPKFWFGQKVAPKEAFGTTHNAFDVEFHEASGNAIESFPSS